jgi:hypothetical protein
MLLYTSFIIHDIKLHIVLSLSTDLELFKNQFGFLSGITILYINILIYATDICRRADNTTIEAGVNIKLNATHMTVPGQPGTVIRFRIKGYIEGGGFEIILVSSPVDILAVKYY